MFPKIANKYGTYIQVMLWKKDMYSGCDYAPVYDNQGNEVVEKTCPFCRTPNRTSDEDMIKRRTRRMDMNDAHAIFNMGCGYMDGKHGLRQDYTKALELCHRAAKLGYAKAYAGIGYVYNNGRGVEIDKKKARHYYELAAMRGDEVARYNLGNMERQAGNFDRALKHYMIAVKGGISQSLERVKVLYLNGHATKDDYTKALQLYQTYLGEIKSKQRDEAAAADDHYRYY